jgi:TetR/AcrR family fatty acid metabolism transcriptional regulator
MKADTRNKKAGRRSKADTRRRILDATLSIAAAKGFEQTTTAEIARRAGVAEGSIYNYFRNKDDLLIHMVSEFAGSFLSELAQQVSVEEDPLLRLERLIAFHIRFFTKEGSIFQVIYGKRPGTKIQMARIIRVAIGPYAGLIEDILREGIAQGRLRDVNAQIAASFLLGGMQLTILRRFFDLADYDPGQAIEEIRGIYLNGLLKR